MTALAGLAAALAPLLRWFQVDIAGPGAEVTVATTGWGSTSLDVPLDGLLGPTSLAWDEWTLAGIPDGAIATVVGVALAVVGVRTALGAGRARTSSPAVATALGVVGLLWMGASWRTADRMVGGIEDMFTRFGAGPAGGAVLVDDAFSLVPGSGFFLCGAAFAVATLAGFAGLWSPAPRPVTSASR